MMKFITFLLINVFLLTIPIHGFECTNGTHIVNDTNPSVCSGNGICIEGNICKCNINYEGNSCNITKYQCYGINYDGINVCGSLDDSTNYSGDCINDGNMTYCSCKEFYEGDNCNVFKPSCYGIEYDNTTICSGNGTCVDLDVCDCGIFYYLPECAIAKETCYGRPFDLDACNVDKNHGSCSNKICTCNENYEGLECETRKLNCFGINYDNSDVCSDEQGICSSNDNCTCSENYEGTQCETTKHQCFGINYDNANVCTNQQGICSSNDNCECSENYQGTQCETLKYQCFGINYDNGTACSGRGACFSEDFCECTENYEGTQCETLKHQCFGINHDGANVCTNQQGICSSVDNCTCSELYEGTQCEIQRLLCFGIVYDNSTVCNSEGTCIAEDNCTCTEDYEGLQCETKKYQCSGKNYDNETVCSGAAQGSCESQDNCICTLNYEGTFCHQRKHQCFGINYDNETVCTTDENGYCHIDPGLQITYCNCRQGYEGLRCENLKHQCFGIYYDDATVCTNQQGVCSSNDTCTCSEDYEGTQCETTKHQCSGINYDNTTVCTNQQGACSSTDNCTCTEDYEGTQCETRKYLCHGINYDGATVCTNQQGSCTAVDTCECFENYEGTQCETVKYQCNGVNYDNSAVCGGAANGTCSSQDVCTCIDDTMWGGINCDEPVCSGIVASNPLVCSSGGSCTSPGTCSCDEGYYGTNCENFQVCHNRNCNNGRCIEDRSDPAVYTCDCNFYYNTFGSLTDYCTTDIHLVDQVCIRDPLQTDSYLGITSGTGQGLSDGNALCRGWEEWDIVRDGSDLVLLRSHYFGTYFSIRDTGVSQVAASAGAWERFNITQVATDGSSSLYTIVSATHGTYVNYNSGADEWEAVDTVVELEISSMTNQYRKTANNMWCRQDDVEQADCICGVGIYSGHCADPDVQTNGLCIKHIGSNKFIASGLEGSGWNENPTGFGPSDSCNTTGSGGWNLIKTSGKVVMSNVGQPMVLGSESGTDQLWSMNSGAAGAGEQFTFTYLGNNEYNIQDGYGDYLYWDSGSSKFKTSSSIIEKWTVEDHA